ncbi:MAG: transporter [Longimicrobiaceae bacterium]
MKRTLPLALLLLAAPPALAQDRPAPIQDNSFLIEEAYNQESGVVQHISAFSLAEGGRSWAYGFTQEWPIFGRRHQASFTLPLQNAGESFGRGVGVGDVALHYRYMLAGVDGGALAVAPRLSVMVPTGSAERGRGAGGAAVQVNLPVSLVLSPALVAHTNAGATLTPAARDAAGNEARTTGVNLGQSLVWLLHPKANLLLEAAWARDEEVTGPGARAGTNSLFLSPGVRFAIDFPSGLQVVPGVAVPIGVGPSSGERGVFLYLSLEHPYSRSAR